MSPADRAPRIAVAGTVYEVGGLDDAGHAWVVARYAPFLVDRAPDIRIAVSVLDAIPDDDGAEPGLDVTGDAVHLTMGGYRLEGDLRQGRLQLIVPPLPTVLSPAVFRVVCALVMLRAGGLLLHASAVVDGDEARMFCGPSGIGKSTVARLAGDRPVLSDETVGVLPDAGAYAAAATPFFGENGPVATQTSGGAALTALFFLRQSTRFAHRRLARREAVERAFAQVFLPKRLPSIADAVLEILDTLTAAVPCYELEFAVREELWRYVDAVA